MKNQRGQMLLIIILLMVVLLTVALSVSQVATQETKISKLEEDSKRAFAAAEAGLEARLQMPATAGNLDIAALLPGSGIQSGTATLTTNAGNIFYAPKPLTSDDSQLTFYLTGYDKTNINNPFSANLLNGQSLMIYFGTNGQTCDGSSGENRIPNLELTLLDAGGGGNFKRDLIKPSCGKIDDPDNQALPNTVAVNQQFTQAPGKTFKFKTTLGSGYLNNYELLLVRVIFGPGATSAFSTNILFQAVNPSTNLPVQGQTVTSDAKTTTNVAKKIELFQSYPQIPADLFVTSF